MKRFFKNAVALLAVLAMLICCCPFSALASDDSGLKFNNGKFKILILSDLQDTDEPQQETVDMITSAITKTEPDLIVLLGDNIAGWWKGVDKAKTDEAIDVIGSTIEKSGVPFALVFGNHDHEGLASEENGYSEERISPLERVSRKSSVKISRMAPCLRYAGWVTTPPMPPLLTASPCTKARKSWQVSPAASVPSSLSAPQRRGSGSGSVAIRASSFSSTRDCHAREQSWL